MLVTSQDINCCFKGIAVINFFWSISFELPVCASLSDTRSFTYRMWDMLVDQNLYVQTICSYYEFPRQRKFMGYWINHNSTVKTKTVQPVPKIQPV